MNNLPVTQPQLDLIIVLCRRHSLSLVLLSTFCERQFGVGFVWIDRGQASQLIDALKEWQTIPVELQKAAGQLEMFGAAS